LVDLRKIVSNFGFLLQVAGLLLILPIAIGLQNAELQPVASLIATCFLSFALGFVLNSFCERKELDEKTSLWLMIINFTVLPLVLMIPYIWNNVFTSGNPFDLITNAYFETVSGFTTTGFTFITSPESLPISLLFYRSLVEFIGGIGFIYILVAFLHPNHDLGAYAEAFGIAKLGDNLKKVFLTVLLVYTLLVVIFTAIFYFLYPPPNLIIASCTAIDVLTGGYQPNTTPGISIFHVSVLILMLLGSFNFKFHYSVFRLKVRDILTREVKLYLEIIAGATVLMAILAWINPFDSLFHVVTMLSSTGMDYINVGATPAPARIAFIILGLIGGCTFSMAGGIRIERIQTLIDAIRKKDNKPDREELKAALINVIGLLLLLFVFSAVFSTIGISFLDSVFEISSALTTNGISMGITTVEIAVSYKWLLILAMLIGRIEILVILKAIGGRSILSATKRFLSGLSKKKSGRPSYTISTP